MQRRSFIVGDGFSVRIKEYSAAEAQTRKHLKNISKLQLTLRLSVLIFSKVLKELPIKQFSQHDLIIIILPTAIVRVPIDRKLKTSEPIY